MYEKLIADMKSNLQPLMDVAEINRKTLEKLTEVHTEYATDCFNAGLKQIEALTEVKDPQKATELQIKFVKDLDGKTSSVVEQSVTALTKAKDDYSKIMEQACARMTEGKLFEDVTKVFNEALTEQQKAFNNVLDIESLAAGKAARKPAPKKAS